MADLFPFKFHACIPRRTIAGHSCRPFAYSWKCEWRGLAIFRLHPAWIPHMFRLSKPVSASFPQHIKNAMQRCRQYWRINAPTRRRADDILETMPCHGIPILEFHDRIWNNAHHLANRMPCRQYPNPEFRSTVASRLSMREVGPCSAACPSCGRHTTCVQKRNQSLFSRLVF